MSELSKEILQAEFQHINGVTYLDHAGTTLYSSKQLEDHTRDLATHLYSNPHSTSPSSKLTTALIDSTRELVLRHFCTDLEHYDVVFTAGCTAALDLLSRTFPWERRSLFCYLDDNHTSVVGMREEARRNGAKTVCLSASDLRTAAAGIPSEPHPPPPEPRPPSPCTPHHHLFAYPAQSNFSGHKYPLTWCQDIADGRLVPPGCEDKGGVWSVLLDVASLVSTSPLDLSASLPHFATLSFYKLFGFPTGLGALLVRRDQAEMLTKHYYGGGTVKATDSWTHFHMPKDQLHDRLEDGTLPFLDILALRHGFATLTRLGTSMEHVQRHTFSLARCVYTSLSELQHSSGGQVCEVYCDTDYSDANQQGPVVNFNLLRPDRHYVGYSQVEKLASVFNIHLRTGCFCNTGACMRFLGMDSATLRNNLQEGHECGDSLDLIDGRPTGSVRISFGYMSTQEDVQRFLGFIGSCFVESPQPTLNTPVFSEPQAGLQAGLVAGSWNGQERGEGGEEGCGLLARSTSLVTCGDPVQVVSELDADPPLTPLGSSLRLHSITLYPVKSCAGFKVQQWPTGEKGLLFDREWMIVNESGSLLSLKQEPKLCLIHPSVSLQRWTLTLSAEGHDSVVLPAQQFPGVPHPSSSALPTRVCGDSVRGEDCGAEVAEWLTHVLGRRCHLIQQSPRQSRQSRNHAPGEGRVFLLSLANEAQYLLLSRSSLKQLLATVTGSQLVLDLAGLASRFRANFVVDDSSSEMEPYSEDRWKEVRIGSHLFQVTGKCVRCQVVCVDPSGGGRSLEPLRTLLDSRGSKASFGIYLTKSLWTHEL